MKTQTLTHRLAWVALATLVMLVAPVAAFAQDDSICNNVPTLRSGDTVERTISDRDFIWAFCFDGDAGEEITVDVDILSGDLDAFMAVFPEDNDNAIAELDPITNRTTPDQLIFDLPEDGTYILGIARFGMEDGESTGSFQITLTIGAGAGTPGGQGDPEPELAAGTCPDEVEVIDAGTQVTGMIDDNAYFAGYCFYAEAGDVVTFSMEATDGNLDTLLLVTDPNVAENYAENDDCDNETTNSCVEIEIPATGNYLVAAGRYGAEDGGSSGEFSLTFDVTAGTGGGDEVVGGLPKDPPTTDEDPEPTPGGDEPDDEIVFGDPDDCTVDPRLTLTEGLWEFTLEDDGFRATFDFACDGSVVVEVEETDGTTTSTNTTTTEYTLELEADDSYTLTIDLANGSSLRLENAVVVESGILALLDGESLIVLLNVTQ